MFYSPAPLHIPDGFLSLVIALVFWGITIITVGVAISKTNQSLGEKQVPLMGIMAAFIFAAQMLNFPVAGGTSGHFLGGALAAMVLGPWAGILVMTAVIALQALLFQDGGLLVMGANIFNMGLLTAMIGFRPVPQRARPWQRRSPDRGGCSSLAGGGCLCAAGFLAALAQRHVTSGDRRPGDAGGACADRAGRSRDHGGGACFYRAHPPRFAR